MGVDLIFWKTNRAADFLARQRTEEGRTSNQLLTFDTPSLARHSCDYFTLFIYYFFDHVMDKTN